MIQIPILFAVKCDICGGEMVVNDSVWRCQKNERHTMRDVQGISIWEGDVYVLRYFWPSPIEPPNYHRPCRYCRGDMVLVNIDGLGDGWICNRDLRHRLRVYAGWASWSQGLLEDYRELAPEWTKNKDSEFVKGDTNCLLT